MRKILIGLILLSYFKVSGQSCTPDEISSVTSLNKAVASVSYDGYNFTGAIINNNNSDGRLLFVTSSYPFNGDCDNGLNTSINSSISNISFKWSNGNSTSGAILREVQSEIAILELSSNPPFDIFTLLGFHTNSSDPERCISSYPFSSKGLALFSVGTYSNSSYIQTNCDYWNPDSYIFSNSANSYAFKINYWNAYKKMEVNEYSKGAPLFNYANQIIGIYVTHEYLGADCKKEQARFVKMSSFDILGNITSKGAIEFTPCKNHEVVDYPVSSAKVVTASIRIIGTSIINNVEVIFRAGEEVILRDGFDSGNNFIAEIMPCSSKIETITPTNKQEDKKESFIIDKSINLKSMKVKAFPNVLVEDVLKIETTGIENLNYFLINIEGKLIKSDKNINQMSFSIELPNLSDGIYFLKIGNVKYSKTIKIIKQ